MCSGNEIGPFKAIEESTVAQLTTSEDRPTIFAWYAFLSGASAALGSLSGGWITQYLQVSLHWTDLKAFRFIFLVYTACGLIKCLLSLSLSEKCEAPLKQQNPQRPSRDAERTRLIDAERRPGSEPQSQSPGEPLVPAGAPKRSNLLDSILGLSFETRGKMGTLSALFGLDNLASGLVPLFVLLEPDQTA